MAQEATVKLTLNASGFLSAMGATTATVEATAKKMEVALADVSKTGFGAMNKGLADIDGSLKSTITTVGTLSKAVSAGALAKGGLTLESQFKDIAIAAKAGGKATLNWRVELENAQGIALATGQTTADLGNAFKALQGMTDVDFARAALEPLGVVARATGESVLGLANIATALRTQFGITAQELPEALVTVVSMAKQGGMSIDDMSGNFGVLATSARNAGIEGAEGFRNIVALANTGVQSAGNMKKSFAAVATLLDSMGTDAMRIKLGAHFQLDTRDKSGAQRDAMKVLSDIFKATGAKMEELQALFTGDHLELVMDLGQPYRQMYEQTPGTVNTRTEAAAKAFEAALNEAGKAAINYAGIQAEASERARRAQSRLTEAVEKTSAAITKPEMLDAIARLSESLPKLAEKVDAATKSSQEAVLALSNLANKIADTKPCGGGGGSDSNGYLNALLTAAGLIATAAPSAKTVAAARLATALRLPGLPGLAARVTPLVARAAPVLGAALGGFTVGKLIANAGLDIYESSQRADEFIGLSGMNVDSTIQALKTRRITPDQAEATLSALYRDIDQARLNSHPDRFDDVVFGEMTFKEFNKNKLIARRGGDLIHSLEWAINQARSGLMYDRAQLWGDSREAKASAEAIGAMKDVSATARGVAAELRQLNIQPPAHSSTQNRGPIAPSPSQPGHGR